MTETVANVKDAVAAAIEETGFNPDGGASTDSTVETTTTDDTPSIDGDDDASVESATTAATDDTTDAVVEEEEFKPSAEDLKIIDENPELKKVYRSLQRGWQAKTEGFANKRKEMEAALETIKVIQADPVKAAKAMAIAAGLKIVEEEVKKEETKPTKQPLLDRITSRLTAKLGAEAATVLAPELLEAVKEIHAEESAPLKEALEAQQRSTSENILRNAVTEFGNKVIADGGEWNEEVEKEMTGLIGKIIPGQGTTLPEFLEVLHNNVQANHNKKATTSRKVDRLRAAAAAAEPRKPARAAASTSGSITAGMDSKTATNLAVELATKELSGRP